MPTILAESTTIADNSPGKNYHQTHLSGREHVMGHGLIMFPGNFCQDSSPTQLHALFLFWQVTQISYHVSLNTNVLTICSIVPQ